MKALIARNPEAVKVIWHHIKIYQEQKSLNQPLYSTLKKAVKMLGPDTDGTG
jgi:hypothetical protein